jgi:hypothetical protein
MSVAMFPVDGKLVVRMHFRPVDLCPKLETREISKYREAKRLASKTLRAKGWRLSRPAVADPIPPEHDVLCFFPVHANPQQRKVVVLPGIGSRHSHATEITSNPGGSPN